jgi:4-aminobutyrate aminotransferase-like enzyme
VLENTRRRGEQLAAGLGELATKFPYVADVRGRGLLWGFEFVLDPETRASPDPAHKVAGVFVDAYLEQGLIVYPGGIAPLNNASYCARP